jgi:hypothetical protein
MYEIIQYQNLSDSQLKTFYEFLRNAWLEKSQPAHVNMWADYWNTKDYTLPYLLEKTDRFKKNGNFNILFDNNKVIACSGVYQSAFCEDLVIAGTRTWIDKDYRNLSIAREFLLPAEKEWAIKNNYKAIALCFNDYNKNMIKIWGRIRLGENRTTRQPHHIFYNGLNEVKHPVMVQYTRQFIAYEKLDPEFSFNWSSIKML